MKGRQRLPGDFWRFPMARMPFGHFWGGDIGSGATGVGLRKLFERSERLVDDVLLFPRPANRRRTTSSLDRGTIRGDEGDHDHCGICWATIYPDALKYFRSSDRNIPCPNPCERYVQTHSLGFIQPTPNKSLDTNRLPAENRKVNDDENLNLAGGAAWRSVSFTLGGFARSGAGGGTGQ